VRRPHSVFEFQELRKDLRLVLKHVETSRGYPMLRERSFINHVTTGSVNQDRRRLHHPQLWLADEMPGFGGERNMQVMKSDSASTRSLLANSTGKSNRPLIVVENEHVETGATSRDGLADPPHAENPQRAVMYVEPGRHVDGATRPFPGTHPGVGFGDAASSGG
jgi:hypothetical protein